MTLTLDEFIDGMRGGCDTPGCNHAHGVMHLRSRCHPTAGADVSVDAETCLLRVQCHQCAEAIVEVDLGEDIPEDTPPALTTIAVADPAPTLGSLTPERRAELAGVGHRAAMGMRDAMAAQEAALRAAIRGLDPNSDDGIEAIAIVFSAIVRVSLEDMTVANADDFVRTVVAQAGGSFLHTMSAEVRQKLAERAVALVRGPIPMGKPVVLS